MPSFLLPPATGVWKTNDVGSAAGNSTLRFFFGCTAASCSSSDSSRIVATGLENATLDFEPTPVFDDLLDGFLLAASELAGLLELEVCLFELGGLSRFVLVAAPSLPPGFRLDALAFFGFGASTSSISDSSESA